MGQELWTSPITGYRRKGTRLSELRTLIDLGFTARAIMEPLQSCPLGRPATAARQALEQREFDVAGVKHTRDGPVIGWVSADSLVHGHVADHWKPFGVEQLVSDASPLASVMMALRDRARTFVLVGTKVAGIVTRADLNKPPMRVYMFSLISLLEMHLSFWIRAEHSNDSWVGRLSAERVESARRIQTLRRKRNQAPFLIECLEFCDKRDLVVAEPRLRTLFALGSKTSATRFLERAEGLRDLLAHSQRDLVDGSSWENLINLLERVEMTVRRSDEQVETAAVKHSAEYRDELWAAA